MAKFTFIDLFAGIGGIRLGFEAQGGQCVFSSEWDSDPSGLILASDTAAEVSRWLESWRTVCSVRSAGSCTRTVSGIHIVRCLISTCRLSRVPVEVVRCLHGQQADSKPMIRHKISVLIRFRFGLVRPGRRPF